MESILRQFPPEIYAMIIANIKSKLDLRSLMLTSRIINCEAERVLYSAICILSPEDSVLLSYLATCKRAAEHVKIFEANTLNDQTDSDLICASLRNMTNLKVLSLFQDSIGYPPFPFMQLLEAEFNLYEFSTNLSDIEALRLFLRSQPRIQELFWIPLSTPSFQSNFFLPSDLQELTTVTGAPSLAHALLPSRNAKRLRAIGPISSFRGLFTSIEVLAHWSHLSDLTYSVFPNLRYIKMYRGESIPASSAHSYCRFPQLEKVKLEVDNISIASPFWARFASETFKSNPNIKIVEFFAFNGQDGQRLAEVVRFEAQRPPVSPEFTVISTQFVDEYILHSLEWQSWS